MPSYSGSRRAGVTRILFVVSALPVIAALPARAEMFGPGFQPCGEKTSTVEVVDCVQEKTNFADQRLNAAYKALQAQIDANHGQPLLAAQRLWVQYQDANCAFYGTQDGSIRQVQAAECLRSMTEDRARELEKAMKLD
jgi:uncharacterized protein YecT (DUF1311 family)